MNGKLNYALWAVCLSAGILLGGLTYAQELSGSDVVQRCDLDTDPGRDQHTTLTVVLSDAAGNVRKNIYQRFWKDAGGKKKIADKMMLFTEFPPDARGTGFMRWGYLAGEDKNADQWLYLPALNTIRRVSVRDPGDSFLGSDLTYQDISPRLLSQDEHVLLPVEKKKGEKFYVVESKAKESDPLYGKVISWYQQADSWADCNKRRIEHYDSRNNLIKVQTLSWQKIDDAWVWGEVKVDNLRNGHSSVFRVSDVSVNVGLKDRMFSERTLKRGVPR